MLVLLQKWFGNANPSSSAPVNTLFLPADAPNATSNYHQNHYIQAQYVLQTQQAESNIYGTNEQEV